jgi:transposase
MQKNTRFVGLDVHAETIAVAVAERGRAGEVRVVGTIPNRAEAVRTLIKKLGGAKGLRVCYEAGPTGYALYWQLTKLGVACEVIAPSLVPVKAGERIKTDRRDALKLARCYRAGELTPVWVPDPAHEALRDLVRAREAAKKDQLRARNRLSKFLLRAGCRPTTACRAWGTAFLAWVRALTFAHGAQQATLDDYLGEVDHVAARIQRLEVAIDDAIKHAPPTLRAVIAGLQALRGCAQLAATTLAVEVGCFSRFAKASQLMAYAGVTPSEHSSGRARRQGAITKTGNAHLRRVLFEIAWSYRHRAKLGPALARRQQGLSVPLVDIGWTAQQRLHKRYRALTERGKPHSKVITAVGRELLGFVWAIATHVEAAQRPAAAKPTAVAA